MNRSDDLELTLDKLSKKVNIFSHNIIIVDNGSSEKHKNKNKLLAQKYSSEYYFLEKNLGVSGGRNFALQKCNTKFVIEIDDDIEFLVDNFIESINNHFEDPDCAIVAFNIVSNSTGTEFRREERPFFNKKKSIKSPKKSAWFIGAGHAFNMEKIKKLKFYREFFPYGSEESDLSLRVYDSGYHIIFDPNLLLHHIKTPSARIPDRSLFAIRLAHRLKVSFLNLPIFSIVSYVILRSLQFIYLSGSALTVSDAFKLLYNDRKYIIKNRKKISYQTFYKLLKIKGHLFF